ncbi:hypothetical protein PN498_10630 [Oscillatoria sp. CS-180]|uniref:hypothetical protein n=1 Tax=Oscillatoria sp. CS-180 TaxID=3021720 RepID=UPI00232BA683|nr:hypothetical protein [Oscillatoria sp. CS-180]MDB9526444.1 hypothetical protein [Oscillatoria sp. CS-180]
MSNSILKVVGVNMRSHLPLKVIGLLLLSGAGACGFTQAQVPPRNIPIHQDWALQPGSEVGDFQVVGSLGDVSIDLEGGKIKAPFDGKVQPADNNCIAFTSPEIPAYLFRLCGVNRPRLGEVEAGEVIGRSDILQFAAMRRQPSGTWAMVEPAVDILERTVGK